MQNIKNILKNKYIWIGLIIICLIIVYIISEKMINTNNLEIANEETEENINEQNDNEKIVPNLQEESVSEIEETVITENTSVEEKNIEQTTSEEIQENEQIYKNMETIEKIYIYITGEVNSPGVVLLNDGSRIVDAIDAAGGVTDKADITKVNLVYELQDGMKVNIPNQKDLKDNENFEYITMSSGDEKTDINLSASTTNQNSESNKIDNQSAFKISIVNINTATQTELETLPGIGPSLALKIINYRSENGKFSSIEDIKNVSGIGDVKYNNIKNYIKV